MRLWPVNWYFGAYILSALGRCPLYSMSALDTFYCRRKSFLWKIGFLDYRLVPKLASLKMSKSPKYGQNQEFELSSQDSKNTCTQKYDFHCKKAIHHAIKKVIFNAFVVFVIIFSSIWGYHSPQMPLNVDFWIISLFVDKLNEIYCRKSCVVKTENIHEYKPFVLPIFKHILC